MHDTINMILIFIACWATVDLCQWIVFKLRDLKQAKYAKNAKKLKGKST